MSPDFPSRIPPHNLDAERAVLGAVLIEGREALPRLIEVLRPSDFYTEAHRILFEAMQRLFDRGSPVDLIVLSEELRRSEQLAFVGGDAALALLVEQASIAAHMMSYAAIVRDMAVLRELIQASTEAITEAFEAKADVQAIVDDAERRIFQLAERRLEGNAVPVSKILKNTFEYIERLYERKEHVTGVATGFEKLDHETSGFQPSDFIIIAGRPSMGKTAFALNIGQYVGVHLRGAVLVLSLEMSAQQLVQRMLCSEAKVDSQAVRTGYLSASDWHRLTAAAGRLSEAKIFIDDSPGLTVLEARAKARRMKAEHGLDLLVIDYLQLMRGRSQENRQQEISEISRSLKALAKEINVPVVALSQLSRAVETRSQRDFRPQLSDLRECATGETLVMLSSGHRVPIRYLVGTAPEVISISPAGTLVTARADRVWRVGRRPVFRVALASGRNIRATAEHRLYAPRGWARIAELSVGDRLAIARRLPEPAACESWHAAGLGLWLKNLGVFGQRSCEKRVPEAATDGTITSEGLARDVSALLLRLGIIARIKSARKAAYRPGCAVRVSGSANQRRFLRTVGAFGPRTTQANALERAPADRVPDTNVDTLPSDLSWDRIVAIEPDGEDDVFDLTVPGPESWLADGIVSHNSGALEQDADLILFLYRARVYKEDVPPDEEKIAEVIIGKQRNGPIGTVKLVFLPEYARFENAADQHRQF